MTPVQTPSRPVVAAFVTLLAVFASVIGAHAQANGITQPTFAAGEVGTVIFRFTNDIGAPTSVGLQPAMAEFQHGRLYIGSGRDSAGGNPLITWWNLGNPRTPVLDQSIELGTGNKPHFNTFWGTKFAPGHQGPSEIWDFQTRTRLSTYNSGAGALWRSLQPPYEFNTTNGYGSSPPLLEVASINPTTTARTRLKLIDLSQLVGFYIGASHPVGNLLLCSASQARGVAVLDISDPVNPRVLSSIVTGNPIYTSMVHGSRLYVGEATFGVRVYDFANPQQMTEVGFIDLPDNPRYISLKEGKGYVTPGSSKLCVFNAADIAQPFTTYTLPSPADFTYPLGNMVVTAGQITKNMCSIIAVDQNPDTQGPKVDFSSPPNGGTRQALTSRVGLVMSDQVDVTSLTTSNVTVRPLGSTTALTGTYSTQMGMVNFAPDVPLLANTIYEVILRVGGVRDVVGNGLRQEFSMRFSTGDTVDAPDIGLVSRYRLDETAGTVAVDEVSARNGTLTNFPAAPWGSGVIAGRLLLDGADDFVNIGTFDTGNTLTVAGWVKIPSGTNNLNTIFTNSTSGYSATGFKLFVYGSTSATPGLIRLESGNGTAGDSAQTTNGVFQYDQWNHVAVTVDRAKGTAAIYYNGVNRTSDATVRNDFQTNQLIQLGQMTNNSNRFRGELDDIHLYNRVLYASEIEALRTERDGPIGHWRLNNSTADDSGGNRPVTLQGGAAFATGAMEGSHALSLDGVNDYVDAGTLDVGQSFTFSGWVQVPAGTGALHNIVGNSATGNAAAGFKLFVYGSTNAQAGRLRIETGNGTTGGDAFTNTGVFAFGQWNHVAVAVDRATGTATIYCNGQNVTADATVRTDFPTNQTLQFGRMTDGGSSLVGALDDLRLHGRSLATEEVRVLSIRTPLAYWPLDNSGADQAGFNRTLTLLGGATFSVDRSHGSHSILLDGNDDRASSTAFEIGNTITLSAWVRIPATSNALETILANGPTTFQGAGFRLFVYGASQASAGRIQLEAGNGTVGNAANTATGVFQFDQWNHVAVTIDRAAGTARIYYNRRDVTADSSIQNDFPTNTPMEVGSMASGANTLVGRVDEVRIFGAIANASQLNALGAGSPNVAPGVTAIASSNPKQTTGTTVTFTATASDGNIGEDLTYSFDFGDGTQSAWSASASAAHSFSAPGRYVVTAFVDDGYNISTRTFVQIVHRPLTANPPTKSTQVAYDTSLNKVWIVNPDIDTVTRIDANTRVRDFEITVGTKPSAVAIRPAGAEVWVLCRDTGDIRVLNSSTGAAIATINLGRGYAPMGLAFAPNGSAAFVACEGAEALLKVSPVTRTVTASLDMGAPPRAVAVSADSLRVFVTRFLSPDTQGQVWEVDPATMLLAPITTTRPANPFPLGIDTTADSENGGRGLPNYLLDAGVSPDGRRLWLTAKKDNIQRGTGPGHSGGALDADNTVRSILCQIDLGGSAEVRVVRKDVDDQGLPAAVCFSPVGDLIFVAYITNNEVLAFDANTGNQVSAATLGSAPSGLTMKPDGTRLYVHNFLSRTVTTLDVAALVNATSSNMPVLGSPTNLIATEKLAANVLRGKRIFYNANDPRMAAEGYISCATCHLDGDHDGRVWDFTDRGEGFRSTIPLVGRSGMGHGPVHWTGNFNEIQDFELDIRNGFGGIGFIAGGTPNPSLGAPNAGRSTDLDDMAAYVSSLTTIPKSPFRNANGTLTAAAVAGQAHFTSKGCATCHSGVNFTDSALGVFRDVGTINASSGKRLGATLTGFDTPTLRGVWATAPYLHRSQAPDLLSVFILANAPAGKGHDRFRELTAAQQDELIRYLLELE
jgi:hypothetical protein